MKIRLGHVSNSSSCSFYVTNKSDVARTLADFARENMQLVDEFNMKYSDNCSHGQTLVDAENRTSYDLDYYTLRPGETKQWIFGDEDGDVIGRIYDYILRDGGDSENFKWGFGEFQR